MTIRFDPLLHPAIILVIIVFLSGLIFRKYRHYRPVISPSYWRLLLWVKIISLTILVVLLVNPLIVYKSPDTNDLNVIFLIDDTGSMTTSDVNGGNRIEFVKKSVLNPTSDFYRQIISQFGSSHFFLFAGDGVRRFQPGTDFDILPGDTDIDPTLETMLTQPGTLNKLGAVVLISDGVDNVGVSLMAAAQKYKKANVPIHCIGIGDPYPRPDLGVTWTHIPDESRKNQAIELSATLSRENTEESEVQVHIFENNRLIINKHVIFDGNSKTKEVKFDYTPFTTGLKTYKIQIETLAGEENQLNNTDFAGIRIMDPEQFRALYFSANTDWNFKFLKIWADGEKKLTLDAIMRLSEQSFFLHGVQESEDKVVGLPECSILNQYDCLILDANSLYLLSSEDMTCIINFVENRGGGILLTGLANEFQDELIGILPIVRLPLDITKTSKFDLKIRPSKVFMAEKDDEVAEIENALFVPDNSEIYRVEGSQVKPGAMEVVSIDGAPWVILAVQHYGAGKTAYLNLPETWKWVMQLDEGEDYFGYFWGRLISWISSASKDRLSVHPASTKLVLTQEQDFSLDVLDDHYNPDNNANIECTVLGAGEERPLSFIPDPKVDGRYRAKFIPRRTGEYRFHFRVQPSRGKALDTVHDYLVVDTSPESEPHPLAEGQLQSLARQTGGSYWNYKNISSIHELRLANNVNFIEEKHNLTEYWWFFAIALSAVLPDWIFRRRIGLK